jgi:hypothetical protein
MTGYSRVSTKLDRFARSIAIAAAIVAWAGMAEAQQAPPPGATAQAKPSKWKQWFEPEGSGGSKWKGWFTLNPKKE